METINGCSVVPSSETPEPVHFGPAESQGAYVVMVGTFPPGHPAPPLHFHPHTDEAFYVADGDATFRLGDQEVAGSPQGPSFSCREAVPIPSGTPATDQCAGSSSSRPGMLSTSLLPAEPAEPIAASPPAPL